MYVEPCCIERQLPALLKTAPYCFFQTGGDCNVSKIISAVGRLSEGRRVLFLAIPEVDVFFLRTLRHSLVQEWYEGIILLTTSAQKETVARELKGFEHRVYYGASRHLVDGALGIFGTEQSVYVQGPMLLKNDFSICTYAAYVGKNAPLLRGAMEAFVPKLHLYPLMTCDNERITNILNYQF